MKRLVTVLGFVLVAGVGVAEQQSAIHAQMTDALSTCAYKGTLTLGVTRSDTLGSTTSCSTAGSSGIFYGDFYTINLTAGRTYHVVYFATGWSGLGTIQDYVTGTVLASTGNLAQQGSLNYIPPSSGTYVVGVGAYGFGPYTLTITDSTAVTPPINNTQLLLNGSRFRVTASYASTSGSGAGTAVPLTSDTGYFWFFSASNVEMVVKVVDGRGFNSHFWVFAGGLTNVDVTLTVTDLTSGISRTYRNPQGVAYQPIQDTAAF